MPRVNDAERKEYQKKYREEHKDRLQLQRRVYYLNNKEKLLKKNRQYQEDNRDAVNATSLRYYYEHKSQIGEKRKPYSKKWYQKNKKKNNEQTRLNYQKNKAAYGERSRKNREKRADWFWEIKCKLECKMCGERHPACLDFHHRNPKEKGGVVSKLAKSASMKRILAEIEKCDALCANCHRKLHCKRDYQYAERS